MLSSLQDVAARRFSQMITYCCYQCRVKKQTAEKAPMKRPARKAAYRKEPQNTLRQSNGKCVALVACSWLWKQETRGKSTLP